MAARLSRRKLASYCADQLVAGKKDVIRELAAYLLDKKRVRELELIVRDIEDVLVSRGIVVADVVSAHELSAETLKQVTTFVATQRSGASVQVRSRVDPNVLGGVKISFSGEELDATIRHKLTTLKASKV